MIINVYVFYHRMQYATPESLFSTLEAEQHNMCKWTGELYLELHNGTYTSQVCDAIESHLSD